MVAKSAAANPSAHAGVQAVLQPASIAVVGASRHRGSIGGELFHNLIESGFGGPVYPVNPAVDKIQGAAAYPSMLALPEPVDLAVIAVPADCVSNVAREAIRRGVKALVVVSAGFAETGPAGAARQAELLAICRQAGVRLVGPNCMGVVNTAPGVAMNAQFAPIRARRGGIAVMSQSGALGIALIHEANRLGLGISQFVSVGNQADLSGDDFLEYWATDRDTHVILLYLESIADPRRFARICRRVARTKPIVAVKSGRSAAGARATSSHTGALIGASDVTVDALFRQAGAIRTDTLAEMFDVAALLADQPLPSGRRVAIVTNGGGPGILAADACAAAGLEVPAFSEPVRARLAEQLPTSAWAGNPVDMIASATPADYAVAMDGIAASAEVDGLLVIAGPPLGRPTAELATTISVTVSKFERPLTAAAVLMSTEPPRDALAAGGMTVPAYAYPENAARALGHVVGYADWRRSAEGVVRTFTDVRDAAAKTLIAASLRGDGAGWLGPQQVRRLLRDYGLPLVDEAIVTTPAQAAAAAARFGRPIALKATARRVIHKTEAHGVRLGLAGAPDVAAAATEMAAAYAASGTPIDGYIVQPMVGPGVEMLVGVVHDQLFGPIVACAAGGTQAELMRDVSVRITPLTDADATQMVRSLATFPLLDGYRGAPKSDVAALEDVLLRVSAMVEAHPEIAEMDLNPVIVLPTGAVIVDARVRLDTAN